MGGTLGKKRWIRLVLLPVLAPIFLVGFIASKGGKRLSKKQMKKPKINLTSYEPKFEYIIQPEEREQINEIT